jgi:sigma-B regulation protein RsbU (phosphoserine phosphatase)
LFLYTDGLTEARNPQRELYSSARLSETLRAAGPVKDSRSLVDKMEGEVDRFVDGAVQSDDLTMLAVRYSGAGVFPGEKLSLENDVRQVTRLSEFVKGVSGRLNLSAKTANDIRLAVEETVVNAMNYAYPDGRKGEILVEADTDGKALTFTISDAGAPFDPTAVPDADTTLPAEDRPIGGLGLFLVRNLVDTMHYDRVNDRNILTLVKIINDHTDENDHSRN